MEAFPEFKDKARLAKINEDDLKSPTKKHQWRQFMKNWETIIGKPIFHSFR